MKPADTDALRFVWREQEDSDIEDYAMTVHLFRKVDSPCCANWALKQSVVDQTQNVKDAIERNFYMDDYLDSLPTEKEAISISQQLMDTLSKSGFRLTKWLSNSQVVINSLPTSEVSPKLVNLDLDKLPLERALGMLWDPNSDEFSFKSITKEFTATKRCMLTLIGSIFDPLGIVTPCVLEPKLIVQALWQLKISWDDIAPKELVSRWDRWKK